MIYHSPAKIKLWKEAAWAEIHFSSDRASFYSSLKSVAWGLQSLVYRLSGKDINTNFP